jgi:hypothetical protein
MGTPLTGSTVASTYTSLLKTTDNAALTASLRTISDGNGNDSALQISSAGVASTGTLSVTGAASLSSLSTSGNITVGGNLVVTGTTTLSAGLSVPGTLSCTGNFEVGAAKFTVAAASGNTVVAGTLDVTGNTTLSGDLAVNGNTTIGNASGDSLTVTAGTVAINNLPSKASPIDADTVIIRDSAASNAVKTATISAVSPVRFVYSEDIVKTSTSGQSSAITSGVGTAIQQSGSASAWEYTWTPKTVGNKALIRVSIPVQMAIDGYIYAGIAKSPYAVSDYIGIGGAYGGNASPINVGADAVFTSTSASHTFRIFLTCATQTVTIAANPAGYYFGQNGTTFQAKVHFELIEFA